MILTIGSEKHNIVLEIFIKNKLHNLFCKCEKMILVKNRVKSPMCAQICAKH